MNETHQRQPRTWIPRLLSLSLHVLKMILFSLYYQTSSTQWQLPPWNALYCLSLLPLQVSPSSSKHSDAKDSSNSTCAKLFTRKYFCCVCTSRIYERCNVLTPSGAEIFDLFLPDGRLCHGAFLRSIKRESFSRKLFPLRSLHLIKQLRLISHFSSSLNVHRTKRFTKSPSRILRIS